MLVSAVELDNPSIKLPEEENVDLYEELVEASNDNVVSDLNGILSSIDFCTYRVYVCATSPSELDALVSVANQDSPVSLLNKGNLDDEIDLYPSEPDNLKATLPSELVVEGNNLKSKFGSSELPT